MKIRVLKLGTGCIDIATCLEGTLTHWNVDMGQRVEYLFQPRLLDENGQPVNKFFLCEERLNNIADTDYEEVEIPFEILGTQVTDTASGFTGMAVEFTRHINGCFHVVIQPKGTLPQKNTPVARRDFDLRGCEGEKVPRLTAVERAQSTSETPSPTGDTFDKASPTA